MVQSKRRLAAIMFTDMVGYSSLTQENEALAHELLEEHRRLLRPLFSEHNGTEIKTIGDAFHVEFPSALHAVRCALEIQGMLHGHNLATTPERKIQIRIGIHIADVTACNGDIYGEGVNIASRIEPLADPGGLCISRAVYEQVHGKMKSECVSLGTPDLKNIDEPIEIYKVVLPVDLEEVISGQGKVNEKTPRYSRIAFAATVVFLLALGGWWFFNTTPRPPKIQTLAVLPFADLTPNGDMEYLGDGISEELINALTRVENLHVIPRTSSFAFKGTNETIRSIGRELKADFILEGSVRFDEGNLKITGQLVRVLDESHEWSRIFDSRSQGIFAVQEEIARAIVDELKLSLNLTESEPLIKPITENSDAYDRYLQGIFHRKRFQSRDRLELAISYFEQAIELDPNFARAYTGLADAYTLMQNQGFLSLNEAEESAKKAVYQALELEPDSAEAHFSLGIIIYQFDRDIEAAAEEMRASIELDPSNYEVHHIFAQLLEFMGRLDEALDEALTAVALNPVLVGQRTLAGRILFQMGRDQEAIEQFEHALELEPEQAGVMPHLGRIKIWAGDWLGAEQLFLEAISMDSDDAALHRLFAADFLVYQGRFEESNAEFQYALQLVPDSSPNLWYYARGLALSRDFESALSIMEKYYNQSPQDPVGPLLIARILVMADRIEEASRWLEDADALRKGSHPRVDNILWAYQGIVCNRTGDPEGALNKLEMLLKQEEIPDWAFAVSLLYLDIDDYDSFFKWMSKSYENRDPLYLTIKVHPMLDKARSDPRFDELLSSIGLAE